MPNLEHQLLNPVLSAQIEEGHPIERMASLFGKFSLHFPVQVFFYREMWLVKSMKLGFLQNRSLIFLGGLAAATLAGYVWMIRQPFFETFITWAQQNLFLYIGVLILLKVLALVWPPLPGSVFTIGSIPIIGWFYAALAEVIGRLLGASISFYIGKRYGYQFLRKFFDENIVAKIRKFRIVKEKELEALFLLRLFTGVVSEAISYGAGILGVRYRNFFLATLLVSFLDFPLFYLANSIFTGKNVLLSLAALVVVGILFWKLRGRYFE